MDAGSMGILSSPCEPKSSGELIKACTQNVTRFAYNLLRYHERLQDHWSSGFKFIHTFFSLCFINDKFPFYHK